MKTHRPISKRRARVNTKLTDLLENAGDRVFWRAESGAVWEISPCTEIKSRCNHTMYQGRLH